jgi:signal transduction histidine kinase
LNKNEIVYPEGFILKHSTLSIVMIYNIVMVCIATIFYPLLPLLMAYPPFGFHVSNLIGTNMFLQYVVAMAFIIVLGNIYFSIVLRGTGQWKQLLTNTEANKEKLEAVRRKCINIPNISFILQISIVTIPALILVLIICAINGVSIFVGLKIIVFAFSFFSIVAVFFHIFTKRIFTRILYRTYKGEGLQGIRIGLKYKIFLQILPLIVVAILFTAMLGYSRLIVEKGNLVYNICKAHLKNDIENIGIVKNEKQIFDELKEFTLSDTNISFFVVTPKGEFVTKDKFKPSGVFNYYLKYPLYGEYKEVGNVFSFFYNYKTGPDADRVYGDTNETQGVVMKVKGETGTYIAGIKYELGSNTTADFFTFAFIALIFLNIFMLYYFSKTLSGEISIVTKNLTEIAEGEDVNFDKKLAVISNDELGDLVIAFNKVQEREKQHAIESAEKQSILMEQERLATLGHLIGGIAHNLRTPIMSISGAIEGLKDLVGEYDESLHDKSVTIQDHHEIAVEMDTWLEKMKPYCSYMSDIITAVKDQTVHQDNLSKIYFTLKELSQRVEILLEQELRKRRSKLKIEMKADPNRVIFGEIGVLVQVVNNLILNATDAYQGNGGDVEFTIAGDEKVVELIVRDFGQGISEEIKDKLFNQMITTKGTKGTGLGLYMSNSNIKARFGGKMRFESEIGKGTTFYINLPVDKSNTDFS